MFGAAGRNGLNLFVQCCIHGRRLAALLACTFTFELFASWRRIRFGQLEDLCLAGNISDVPVAVSAFRELNDPLFSCVLDGVASS